MPKRHYVQALVCYLLIPVVVIVAGILFRLVDPEIARGHANYVRDYRLLELTRLGVLITMVVAVLALWASTCHLVLKSRRRSVDWLWLAALGPFGFSIIAMLEDRAPTPGDRYQHFISKLKPCWRVLLEVVLFVAVWSLAFEVMELKRALMIGYESFVSGAPAATILERQNASGGMWAFSGGMEALYLVVLIYLLWPIFFNLAGQRFKQRPHARRVSDEKDSGSP